MSLCGWLALLISVGAYLPYLRTLVVSDVRPTISSWLSWLAMDAAILAGMIAKDAVAPQMVAYVSGSVVVIIISCWKGATTKWTWVDYICLSATSFAVGLWSISGDADWAIVLGLVAGVFGTIPMQVNLWKNPASEALLPWFLWLVGGVFGIGAIEKWTIAGAATPLVFLVLQITTVLLIARKFRQPSAFK